MAKGEWTREEVRRICAGHDLMPGGALEIINEWSYENRSSPLIEDGDPVFFDVKLAKEIFDEPDG